LIEKTLVFLQDASWIAFADLLLSGQLEAQRKTLNGVINILVNLQVAYLVVDC
jgi:hypothetical protein